MKKFFLIIIIILLILGAKFLIDFKTYDANEIVSSSLSSYYTSGNKEELKPIIELLDKYKYDDAKRSDIQTIANKIVGSWYTYLDDKYLCNLSNLNACKAQLDEFNILNNKLEILYKYKCDDGFTIIFPSIYTNLKSQGDLKVSDLNKVINNPNAKNPLTSEEIHARKCLVAVDCTDCRDGVCTCYYLDENTNREEVRCQKNFAN